VGGLWCAHGRAVSTAIDNANNVASSCGRPMSCTANGNPSSVNPAGSDTAGFPVKFHNVVNAANRCAANNNANHPLPDNSPIRNGGRGVTGDNTWPWHRELAPVRHGHPAPPIGGFVR
jgi:hypothetical protein